MDVRPRTVIVCPDCHHRQTAMSIVEWKECENTQITFSCKKCPFKDTRDGILWGHLIREGRDKNGC